MDESPKQEPDSIIKQVLKWVFTIVAIFMLARLAVAAVIFAGRLLGLLREGNILEQISDANPTRLAINIAIVVVIVIVVIVAGMSKSESKEKSSVEDDKQL